MSDSFLDDRRRGLEEAFFTQHNRDLLDRMRQKASHEEALQALTAASGITNLAVLEELLARGVRPETLAALSLLPLVLVAWADGSIQEAEHKAVLEAAADRGVAPGSAARELLEGWLQIHPHREVVEAWKDYVAALVDGPLDEAAAEALEQDVLGRAREVASAAGGFLGLGSKVSDKEEAVLANLAEAFV
jgi:hypothetical protein